MTLTPLGDSALVLSLGEDVNDAAIMRVRGAAEAIRQAKVEGVVDVVPAFTEVTVFYDIARVGAFADFSARLSELAKAGESSGSRGAAGPSVEIPVCYGGEYGLDIDVVAAQAGGTVEEVIAWHSAAEYRVHAIGFVPGFAYLGGLPRRLQAPRRATPRPSVPAGSVGIGGAQTGVYPVSIPGGWNIIGRSPLAMFDLGRSEPALLHVGDRVKFRAISPEELAAWK